MGWDERDRAAAQQRVQRLAALPGVEPEHAEGHLGLSVRGRRFAWLQADHQGDGRLSLVVKVSLEEQRALLARGGRFFRPAYLGARGWIGIDLAGATVAVWEEAAALLEQAWRAAAPRSLVTARDGEPPLHRS